MGARLDGPGTLSDLARLLCFCCKHNSLLQGQRAHHCLLDSGYDNSRFLANWLVHMYGQCGLVDDARAVFGRIRCPNTHSWSILLAMYAVNGRMDDAAGVFCGMIVRESVAWNSLMTAHLRFGSRDRAMLACSRMHCESVQMDKIGFVCALDACGSLEAGKELHVSLAECGYVRDAVVGTALLTMYGRHRSVEDAKLVFRSIDHRDRSCWNAMLAALTQNHDGKEALDLFHRMQCAGEKPDIITFVCVLDGCASVSTALGQVVHASIVEQGIDVEHVLGTALVDMYGKYGNLDDAFCMFSKAPHANVISWNAIISVFAQNGYGSKSLDLFDRMQRQCIGPDYTTLVSVLTACSHGGLVNLGWYFFVYMDRNYGIERTIGHCCCMIDLLGRAGHLEEAELLLNQIPLEADDTTWRSLLGACKMHSDVERGIRIANRCLALHPADAAPYVTLLNLHAISGNEAWQKTQSCEDLFVG